MRGTFGLQVNNTNYFRANASLENTYLSGILYAIVGSKAIGKGTGIDNCEFCRNIEFQNANLDLVLDKTKPNSTRFGVSIGTDLKFDSTGKITDLLSKVFPAVKGAEFKMNVTRATNGSSVSYSIHFVGSVAFATDRVMGGYVQFLSKSDEGTCNPGKGVEVTFERKPKNGDPNMANTDILVNPCIRFHLSNVPFVHSDNAFLDLLPRYKRWGNWSMFSVTLSLGKDVKIGGGDSSSSLTCRFAKKTNHGYKFAIFGSLSSKGKIFILKSPDSFALAIGYNGTISLKEMVAPILGSIVHGMKDDLLKFGPPEGKSEFYISVRTGPCNTDGDSRMLLHDVDEFTDLYTTQW